VFFLFFSFSLFFSFLFSRNGESIPDILIVFIRENKTKETEEEEKKKKEWNRTDTAEQRRERCVVYVARMCHNLVAAVATAVVGSDGYVGGRVC